MTYQEPSAEQRRSTRFTSIVILVAILAAVGFLAVKCGDLVSGFTTGYKTEARFLDAMKLVAADPRVIEALGEPVTEQGLYNYEFYSGTDGAYTIYGIDLAGPKAKGKADVKVAEDAGKRTVTSAVFTDDKGKITNLLVDPGI
jgi:hypothetical protein